MPLRPDVVTAGAVALVPALDIALPTPSGRTGQIALVVGLAVVAVIALLVAAAAYQNDPTRRKRSSFEEEELFTTTPLPMPKEELERMAAEGPPHLAFRQHRLPQWVQVGSVVAALAITWVAAQRLRGAGSQGDSSDPATGVAGADSTAPASSLAEDIPAAPGETRAGDAAARFAFRARDWVSTTGGAGCVGRLEVTKGAPSEWELTARVRDDGGQLIDSARARVGSLREGEVVLFTFARTKCARIGTWDVSGDRTAP